MQYVRDSDEGLARAAIRAVGQIALKARRAVPRGPASGLRGPARAARGRSRGRRRLGRAGLALGRTLPRPPNHSNTPQPAHPSTPAPAHPPTPAPHKQVPDVDGILDRLLLFLGYEKDYVTAETLVQVRRRRSREAGLQGVLGTEPGRSQAIMLQARHRQPLRPATPTPSLRQMTDVLRRYPDAAEACVESIAAIPQDVRRLVAGWRSVGGVEARGHPQGRTLTTSQR